MPNLRFHCGVGGPSIRASLSSAGKEVRRPYGASFLSHVRDHLLVPEARPAAPKNESDSHKLLKIL
jgi:hypothetical protein